MAVLLASVLSGHFIASVINIVGAAFVAERIFRGKHMLDALELWKQLPTARRFTYMKLASFSLAFVFTTFRCAPTPSIKLTAQLIFWSTYMLQLSYRGFSASFTHEPGTPLL